MTEFPQWIAIVDDEAPIRRALLRLMRMAGISAQAFSSGAEFFSSLKSAKPACVVLDLHMPGMTGFDVQDRLAQESPEVRVIVITGQDSSETRRRAMLTRPFAYLSKPMDQQSLLKAVELAMRHGRPKLPE